MRPTLPLAAAATASLLVLGAGAAVARGGHDTAARAGAAPTFTIVEHADTDTTTDTGAPGDSVGDVLTFANPVFNKGDKHQVGTDNGFCIRTVAGTAYECTWTNTLQGGSITVTGPFYDTQDSLLAVVGGTGKYARARGEMKLHARDAAGSSYDFTFRLR